MGVLMEVFLKFLTSEPEQRKSVFLKFLTAPTLPNGAQGPHSPLDPTGGDGWLTGLGANDSGALGLVGGQAMASQPAIGYAMAIGIINWRCGGMRLYLRHHQPTGAPPCID